MADGSPIEWLQRPGTKPASWNPIIAWRNVVLPDGGFKLVRGWHCEHVHEGCVRCYAESMNGRLGTKLPYKPGHLKNGDIEIELHESTLLQPLKWRQPRTIFVCSMTDLYGDWVKDEWLDKIKAVQALTPQHTYIELTKRPERMQEYLSFESLDRFKKVKWQACFLQPRAFEHRYMEWPLPNVWGLVSCSTQEDADKFVPILEKTPLAKKGVSLEPLLGPIELTRCGSHYTGSGPLHLWQAGGDRTWRKQFMQPKPEIDWVIVGGESGRHARIMHPKWARSLRDQCAAAEVPFFFKQWGEWAAADKTYEGFVSAADGTVGLEVRWGQETFSGDGAFFAKVGKKAAGRMLDGREHNEFPIVGDGTQPQHAALSPEPKSEEAAIS
jgi:protein gp37